MRGIALSLLLFAVAADAQITPEVTCWRDDTSGTVTTIVFGYTNSGATTTVLKGPSNFVTPPPDAQSQPTSFASGQVTSAFTMSIAAANASAASWTVNGSVVYFNRALISPCASTMCLCPAGPEGVGGPTGPAGPDGAQGATGADGGMGPEGDVGATGPAGPKGAEGDAGAMGSIGLAGSRGVPGPSGPAGAAGERGPVGERGPQGPRGERGDSGSAGVTGPAGPQGETGVVGATGHGGERGPRGPAGVAGADAAPAIRDSASEEKIVRVTADGPSSLLVMATISARAATSGSLQIVVDGVPHGPAFSVGSRATTIPLVATITVSGGAHEVRIASADAEILDSSLTVLVSESNSGKRRSVRQ